MIVALVFFLLVIVFLAVFVGKNLTNVCTFWFFKTYTDLPVSILVFIAFASGIVFSLLCFFVGKFLKKMKEEKALEKEDVAEKSKKSLASFKKKNKEIPNVVNEQPVTSDNSSNE